MKRIALSTLAVLAAGSPALTVYADSTTPPVVNPIAYESTAFTARAGALAQFQLQSFSDPVLRGTSDDFVIRRARIYAAGTVGTLIEWRLDTDDQNQGLVTDINGTKTATGIYLQDVVATLLLDPGFKLDAGLLTVDPSHHATIGATRLYAWDTFTYQGLENIALQNKQTGAPNSREEGLQARGLLLGGRLEYHVALTNGYRNGASDANAGNSPQGNGQTATVPGAPIASNNPFRTTYRIQYNFLDHEDAEYTTNGTYLGTRRIVALSAGYDTQGAYVQRVGEVFVDLPLNGGKDVFTLEASSWSYDGGSFLPTLLRQKDFSFQTGYNFGKRWNPILRYETRRYANPGATGTANALTAKPGGTWQTTPGAFNENREGLGLNYWLQGHNANLKFIYAYVQPRNAVEAGINSNLKNYHQFTGQFQVYVF